MNRAIETESRQASTDALPIRPAFSGRWYGRVCLLLLSTALLTGAFAPVNQFYLAWIGLVPWLIVVAGTRSLPSAFFWAWVGGIFFFVANLWWLTYVTPAGMAALMLLLGLYWGGAGVVLRWTGWGTNPKRSFGHVVRWMVLASAIWVAISELLRGAWPWQGLPWLDLGQTQTPALWICQIADITGVSGVSFLIVMVNVWFTFLIFARFRLQGLRAAGIFVTALVAAALGYGMFRMQHERLVPGPRILVVQPNYPQSNSGQKGAAPDEMVRYHLDRTREALATGGPVDLVVWSETMLPPMNPESAEHYRRLVIDGGAGEYATDMDLLIRWAKQQATKLTAEFHVGMIAGGDYWADFHQVGDGEIAEDRRNVAYFFDRSGRFTDERYDKIHLVPFGEFVPFRYGFPPLYRLMIHFGPPDMQYYFLQAGSEKALTVFELSRFNGADPWRIVTPICFEDIDPGLCAKMCRPEQYDPTRKRADILINLTNDGWFKANENAEHFQAAIFRCIENRTPMARSVNTGISGFIDPLGRTSNLLPVRTEGTSTETMLLCPRVTLFTRWGQFFAWGCMWMTGLAIFVSLYRRVFWKIPKPPMPSAAL